MAVIRKQAYDLTAEDFEIYPVWEYALDEEGVEGQDESTMRPFEHSGPLDTSKQQLFVKAHFTLADGTRFRGWLTPPCFGESDFGTLRVVANRFSRPRDVLVLQMDMWAVAYLNGRRFVSFPLAKTGDSDWKEILSEYALVARNEKASGGVFDNTTA